MEQIILEAKKQGFSVFLLAIVTLYFYSRMEKLEKKLEDCQNEKTEILIEKMKNKSPE